jgi:hypothetical protein
MKFLPLWDTISKLVPLSKYLLGLYLMLFNFALSQFQIVHIVYNHLNQFGIVKFYLINVCIILNV